MKTLVVMAAVLGCQLAFAEPNRIRAELFVREESGEYHRIYGETASLERGADTTNERGYDLYCRAENGKLVLLAYHAGTCSLAQSAEAPLVGDGGSFTLNDGELLYRCHAFEKP
jgi:hypothetical protein